MEQEVSLGIYGLINDEWLWLFNLGLRQHLVRDLGGLRFKSALEIGFGLLGTARAASYRDEELASAAQSLRETCTSVARSFSSGLSFDLFRNDCGLGLRP